jgi:hypothetical protein
MGESIGAVLEKVDSVENQKMLSESDKAENIRISEFKANVKKVINKSGLIQILSKSMSGEDFNRIIPLLVREPEKVVSALLSNTLKTIEKGYIVADEQKLLGALRYVNLEAFGNDDYELIPLPSSDLISTTSKLSNPLVRNDLWAEDDNVEVLDDSVQKNIGYLESEISKRVREIKTLEAELTELNGQDADQDLIRKEFVTSSIIAVKGEKKEIEMKLGLIKKLEVADPKLGNLTALDYLGDDRKTLEGEIRLLKEDKEFAEGLIVQSGLESAQKDLENRDLRTQLREKQLELSKLQIRIAGDKFTGKQKNITSDLLFENNVNGVPDIRTNLTKTKSDRTEQTFDEKVEIAQSLDLLNKSKPISQQGLNSALEGLKQLKNPIPETVIAAEVDHYLGFADGLAAVGVQRSKKTEQDPDKGVPMPDPLAREFADVVLNGNEIFKVEEKESWVDKNLPIFKPILVPGLNAARKFASNFRKKK